MAHPTMLQIRIRTCKHSLPKDSKYRLCSHFWFLSFCFLVFFSPPTNHRHSDYYHHQENIDLKKKNKERRRQIQSKRMKFGKEFTTHLEETLPDWRDKFLCYKPLKKLLKHFPAADFQSHPQPTPAVDVVVIIDDEHNLTDGSSTNSWSLDQLQDWFVRILREELEKFNDFYVDKEEEFVIRFQVPLFCQPCF